MLAPSSPSFLAGCRLGPVVSGSIGGSVGGAQASSGEVPGPCLGSSHSMDVALLALTGRGGFFPGAVLEFDVAVALSFSSMSGRVLVASVLAGCCSGWLFWDVVGQGEDSGGGDGFLLFEEFFD